MSDGKALKPGRYNSYSNCLATLILATIRHRVLFSALFKIGLVEIALQRLSQKQGIESIGRRYWLYQGRIGNTKVQWHSALSYCMLMDIRAREQAAGLSTGHPSLDG